MVNTTKIVTLPTTGHSPTDEEMALLQSVDACIADEGGVTVFGISIGTDEYVLERDMEPAKDGRADWLARYLANMSNKPAAALITTVYLGQRTSYLARALGTRLPLEACRGGRQGSAVGVPDNTLELPGEAEAQSIVGKGCPDNLLILQPHQQAQARLSTRVGGSGLPSTEEQRIFAFLGCKVGILPEDLADLTDPLGDQVRRRHPKSNIISQLGGSLREIRDTRG